MRVLGVDYGRRKIGLALGDTDIRVASPMEVWLVDGTAEELCERLSAFVISEVIGGVVIGIPFRSDGSESAQTLENRQFANLLRAHVRVPVVEVDESFTSKESRRLQEEHGSRVPEDALAAMLILEEYFDRPA